MRLEGYKEMLLNVKSKFQSNMRKKKICVKASLHVPDQNVLFSFFFYSTWRRSLFLLFCQQQKKRDSCNDVFVTTSIHVHKISWLLLNADFCFHSGGGVETKLQ